MTTEEYYDSPESWGDYQFESLQNIINDFIAGRDDDDFTATVPRHKLVIQAKKGVRMLYFDVVKHVSAVELELSPLLNVPIPPDCVRPVRISWVDENGQLHPMAVDASMAVAETYLQDNNFELLFDQDGDVLTGGNINAPRKSMQFVNGGFNPNDNLSKVFTNGKFIFDSTNGVIQFGSEIEGKSVVIEYVSDGLVDDDKIKVHKFAILALNDFIYYEMIKNRRNVPANEKERARREFYNSKRNAKRKISGLTKEDLMQVFKGSSKWIKG